MPVPQTTKRAKLHCSQDQPLVTIIPQHRGLERKRERERGGGGGWGKRRPKREKERETEKNKGGEKDRG